MLDRHWVAVATLAWLGVAGAQASIGDEFRVGVQAGIPSWSMDVEVPLLNESVRLDADVEPSAGIVGQYIMQSDDGSFFVGIEAGIGTENASGQEQLTLLGAPVDVSAELGWVADVAWLAGFDLGDTDLFGTGFGNVSVFGSVGASYAKGEIGVTLPSLGLTGSDEAKHFGWKAGAGVEIEIGEAAILQVRANYTDYETRTYRDQGIGLDVEPGAFEVRATLLYRFDYCDLLGC